MNFGFYYFDTYYLVLVMPAILFALYAQSKVKSTFNKYLRVRSYSGLTGEQVAREILNRNRLHDVKIEHIRGSLTDHYDPRGRVLRLSDSVYNGSSIASIGVAAHEVGHAIQHANSYSALVFRNSLVPIVNFSSKFIWFLILFGFIFSNGLLIDLGIIFYFGVVLFHIITLPVEFNASKRAMIQLENGILRTDEIGPTKRVLDAAALTYVASTLVAVAQLVRLIMLRNRRD